LAAVKDLFIELYLDEDVDVLVADLVRSRGFAAATTLEAGNLGATDANQLHYAASHDRAILTHNRQHFVELAKEYSLAGQHHAGIIIAGRYPAYEVLRRLLRILNGVTAEEIRDQIQFI
jgi:hypothetical protein